MIEHPIPQNITSYQFRLVGDMTLKQFLELAAGFFLAWLIWSAGLPAIIKWPLCILAALSGFALAFLPLEERSLDQWLLSFIAAIYRPTVFTWKKIIHSNIFNYQPRLKPEQNAQNAILKAPSSKLRSLLELYQIQNQTVSPPDPLEKTWLEKAAAIPALFAQVVVPQKLINETTFPKKLPPLPRRSPSEGGLITISLHPLLPPDNPAAILRGEITLPPKTFKAPQSLEIKIAPRVASTENKPVSLPGQSAPLPTASVSHSATNLPPKAVTSASYLPIPTPPIYPNILAGMVLTADGRIIENAIIEIRDNHHLPVRAVKTNRLGQFSIATPLPNGHYELEIEKEGFTFDILNLETKGEIIQPIEIRAQNNPV